MKDKTVRLLFSERFKTDFFIKKIKTRINVFNEEKHFFFLFASIIVGNIINALILHQYYYILHFMYYILNSVKIKLKKNII